MKSNLVTGSILALAALAAGASHAEGREPFPEVNTPVLAQSGTSRAAVQADLAQARHNGYNVNIGRNWTGDAAKSNGVTTGRAAVRAEAIAALASDNDSEGGRL